MGLAAASHRTGVRLHQAREDRKVGSWLSQGVSKVRPATPQKEACACLPAARSPGPGTSRGTSTGTCHVGADATLHAGGS